MADWRISANYYEACNCAHGCPCNMTGFPTHGHCEGTVAFEVTSGERDGVDLAGSKVVSAIDWPGAIHEGNGVMAVWIDADEQQRDALVNILTAQDGGMPWEILATTISDIHGPFFEPIFAEKVLPRGRLIGRAVGMAVTVTGVVLVVAPVALPALR